MIAIGKPGEMPRIWFEGPDWLVEQQVEPGEITSADVQMDDNAMPIPKPLPAANATATS